MEWGGIERRIRDGCKTVRNARGSFRGTFSLAMSPLRSTYLNLHPESAPRINTGYPRHSESERIALDYHAFDIDLWHGCDIAVSRTLVIDSRVFSEPMIQRRRSTGEFFAPAVPAYGNFDQFSLLVGLILVRMEFTYSPYIVNVL